MVAEKKTVLFVCTGNSCRSQIAEVLLRDIAGERFEALSAGSRPAGFVHPLAMAVLEQMNLPTADLTSKHWSVFAETPIDICITVCDNASAECPQWPGNAVQVHWSLPDPAYFDGPEEARLAFCDAVAKVIERRLTALARLPFGRLAPAELKDRLQRLAETIPAPKRPS